MGTVLTQRHRDTEVGDAARWSRVRLGDVATYVNGFAFKPSDWSLTGWPILRIQNLTKTNDTPHFYDGCIDEKFHVRSGDILISWSASLDAYIWQGEDAWLNQHIFKVVFDKREVDKRFFYHQVRYILSSLQLDLHGATMRHITKPIFDALPFSMPPLFVQREIVVRLERELGAVDKLAKKFEELEAAAEAEFKAELKETFEEIKHRGEMHRRSSASKGRFGETEPEGRASVCETQRLGDVSKISYGYTAKARPDDGTGSPKYLRITDIQGRAVEWRLVPVCDCPELDEYRLREGDIVFARTGATTGKSFLIKGKIPLSVYASYLIRVQLNDFDVIDPSYLWYSFDTPDYWTSIQSGMAGAAQGGFNSKKLANLEIPIPSLPVQREVVARLDAAKAKKEKLVAAARRGRETVALMRKAILKEAFE